jgi:pyruvate, water dikinase
LEVGIGEVALVGGKNASLGEMVRVLCGEGISLPDGFATTAGAHRAYVRVNALEQRIRELISRYQQSGASLRETGAGVTATVLGGPPPA